MRRKFEQQKKLKDKQYVKWSMRSNKSLETSMCEVQYEKQVKLRDKQCVKCSMRSNRSLEKSNV